jgi:RsiW-degrading membrane proteinase PrsW (M82 family)
MIQLFAIPLGILPTFIWLAFYLKKDLHPEPRHMIALTFLGGMAVAPIALFAESGAVAVLESSVAASYLRDVVLLFMASAFIEEFLKFSVLRFIVIHNRAFDETVDAMVYLIITALGFAAIENVFILGPILAEGAQTAFVTGVFRFWGANFLHALSSGILGYFFVRGAWLEGLVLATLTHGFFNGAIAAGEGVGLLAVLLLLSGMAVFVSLFFKRLIQSQNAPLVLLTSRSPAGRSNVSEE